MVRSKEVIANLISSIKMQILKF